ncbi:MAG: AAA family ATPase [Candidatus Omnitrophota bacterium]
MEIEFKNTGMIEEAGIELNGLSVIAGKNDTGKSTIGKLLFSIIKTFNRYERDARLHQVRSIRSLIDRYVADSRKSSGDLSEAEKAIGDELKNRALALLDTEQTQDEVEAVLAETVRGFGDADDERGGGTPPELIDLAHRIATVIIKKPTPEDVFKRSFLLYINALLSGNVANKFSGNGTFSITGKEGDLTIFSVYGTPSSTDIRLNDRLHFTDATFFESPAFLSLAGTIRFAKTEFDKAGHTKQEAESLEKAYVPEYIRDLILKLTDRPTRGKKSRIADSIRHIIGGEFYYDPQLRDFVFEKKNHQFVGVSVTPGVKFLGAIGILSLSEFITGNSLLVIDEPETHMHPQWQIKFASVLVQLVKEGNFILVTSHSPYFIEALKLYSDKYLEEKKTSFYLNRVIEDKEATARVNYVTHDISPVLEILGEPFRQLERFEAGFDE